MSDLTHWDLAESFTIHQAAALAVGVDPDAFPEEGFDCPVDQRYGPPAYYVVVRLMKSAYESARNLVEAANAFASMPPAPDENPDEDILFLLTFGGSRSLFSALLTKDAERVRKKTQRISDWLLNQPVPPSKEFSPQLLLDTWEQRFSRTELDRWFRENGGGFTPKYQFVKGPVEPLAARVTDKPLSTTERNTLLRIIAVLAVCGYSIDPKSSRIEKISEILRDADGLGVSISDDTLRTKLREAFAIVGGKPKVARASHQ
ncbi:MAG: hypothetical protein AB7L76_12485 [Burkholderiaceae bacterium]